jgi:hypothetical protein
MVGLLRRPTIPNQPVFLRGSNKIPDTPAESEGWLLETKVLASTLGAGKVSLL